MWSRHTVFRVSRRTAKPSQIPKCVSSAARSARHQSAVTSMSERGSNLLRIFLFADMYRDGTAGHNIRLRWCEGGCVFRLNEFQCKIFQVFNFSHLQHNSRPGANSGCCAAQTLHAVCLCVCVRFVLGVLVLVIVVRMPFMRRWMLIRCGCLVAVLLCFVHVRACRSQQIHCSPRTTRQGGCVRIRTKTTVVARGRGRAQQRRLWR